MEELELLRIRSRFMNAVYTDFGLNNLIELASEIMGNPIYIIDASDRIIAACKQIRTLDSYMRPMIEQGMVSDSELKKMHQSEFKKKIYNSSQAVILTRPDNNSQQGILVPIKIQGAPVAYTCCLNLLKEFCEDDLAVMDEANKAFSIELQKSRIYQDNKGTRLGYQLLNLINTNDDAMLHDNIRFSGWVPKEYTYLLAIPFKHQYRDGKRRSNILLHIFEEAFCGSVVALTESGLVVLLSLDYPFVSENDRYTKLEDLLKTYDLRAGCSPRIEDLRLCRNYFYEAKKAIELSECMGIQQLITHYEDFSLFHMLQMLEKKVPLNHICIPGIDNLKHYDKKRGTNYYETLLTYLTNLQSVSATTEQLQIHRNTLYSRIEKIEEILGFPLNNFKSVMDIMLTVKIQEWKEKTQHFNSTSN